MKKMMVLFRTFITGAVMGLLVVKQCTKKGMFRILSVSNKRNLSFFLMRQWVKVKQEGKNLSEYFEQAGYKKIAVYGMGYIGETLLDELKHTKTEVLYAIDQNSNTIYGEIDIVSLQDELPQVDAIVVTVIDSFETISEKVQNKIECPVISIVDIVYDIQSSVCF